MPDASQAVISSGAKRSEISPRSRFVPLVEMTRELFFLCHTERTNGSRVYLNQQKTTPKQSERLTLKGGFNNGYLLRLHRENTRNMSVSKC